MSIASYIDEVGGWNNLATYILDGLASYTGLPQPPVADQYETYAGSGTGLWLGAGSSPAVQVGDVFVGTLTTLPNGFVWTINPDGTIDVFAGGNSARQEVLFGIYRVASNTIDSGGIVWVNELGPVWISTVFLSGPVGTVIVPINLANTFFVTSPEGDVLSFSVASGSLPPGIILSSQGILSGTLNVVGSYSFTFNATDSTGTSTASGPSSILVAALPPPPTGMPSFLGIEYFQALVALRDAGFTATPPIEVKVTQGTGSQSGFVIGQTPNVGSVFTPGCPVTFTVNKFQFPSVEQNEPIPYWYFFQS